MKKLIVAGVLGLTAILSHAEQIKMSPDVLKIKMQSGLKLHKMATEETNPVLACVYYRAALLDLEPVAEQGNHQGFKDAVNKIKTTEKTICKKIGV